MLTNVSNRPLPNALRPHVMGSTATGIGGVRRASHQSHGSGLNLAGTQQFGGAPGSTKSHGLSQLVTAGHSSISANKLQTTKNASRNALALANTALGRLPTLGLNQIKLEDFRDEDNNMFRVH